MKIGIPQSLLYYYYYPFWKIFFHNLGFEVVLSDRTGHSILNKGVKNAVSEICVPMKVYVGQVLNLLDKNVDMIYVPRFVHIKKGITFCPKFLGLPDMIKHSLNNTEDKILTNIISTDSDNINEYSNYDCFRKKLDISKNKIKNALKAASKEWLAFRANLQKGYSLDNLLAGEKKKFNSGKITIGLLGYVYNIYDNFINMDILNKLRQMGVNVVTFEMLEEKTIEKELQQFEKPVFWEFTNKLLGAGYHFIKSPGIDGIIHLTAFGCGPDSIIGSHLEIDSKKHNKPFMTLRFDEQTGASHLLTRVEAFLDFIKY